MRQIGMDGNRNPQMDAREEKNSAVPGSGMSIPGMRNNTRPTRTSVPTPPKTEEELRQIEQRRQIAEFRRRNQESLKREQDRMRREMALQKEAEERENRENRENREQENLAQERVQQQEQQPAQEPVQEPVQEPTQEPVQEKAQEPLNQPEEPQQVQDQPVAETVQQPQAIDDEAMDILGGAAGAIEALNQEKSRFNTRNDSAMFTNKLNSFNRVHGIQVSADTLAYSVSEAWTLMKSGDPRKYADGQKMLKDSFKATLKQAFDAEKNAAYREHRIPGFADIIKNTNEMYRATMYVFTDMYHEKGNEKLFNATSFGGLDAKEMAEFTKGQSLWSMDQKSDEAWEIQSQAAMDVVAKWEKEKNPYETMIHEMNAIVAKYRA